MLALVGAVVDREAVPEARAPPVAVEAVRVVAALHRPGSSLCSL